MKGVRRQLRQVNRLAAKLPNRRRFNLKLKRYIRTHTRDMDVNKLPKGTINLGLSTKPIIYRCPVKSIENTEISCMYDYVPQEPKMWKFAKPVKARNRRSCIRSFCRNHWKMVRILLQLPLDAERTRKSYRLVRYVLIKVLPKLKPLFGLFKQKHELLSALFCKYQLVFNHYRDL